MELHRTKFLIDECLSQRLVELAISNGYPLSAHVTQRGLTGISDPKLMKFAVAGDWTLVTRNSDDFRPAPGSASKAPCYASQPLHAGLICLNLPSGSTGSAHLEYFRQALAYLSHDSDLTNKVLEVNPPTNQHPIPTALAYDFPSA